MMIISQFLYDDWPIFNCLKIIISIIIYIYQFPWVCLSGLLPPAILLPTSFEFDIRAALVSIWAVDPLAAKLFCTGLAEVAEDQVSNSETGNWGQEQAPVESHHNKHQSVWEHCREQIARCYYEFVTEGKVEDVTIKKFMVTLDC